MWRASGASEGAHVRLERAESRMAFAHGLRATMRCSMHGGVRALEFESAVPPPIPRGDDAGARTSDVAVLVHGACQGAGAWIPFVDAMLEAGYARRVLCVDLPGFGPSRFPAATPLGTASQLSRMLAGSIAAWYSDMRLDGAILVGYSFGAHVCVHASLLLGSRISRLVLVAPVGLLPTLGPFGFWWAVLFRARCIGTLSAIAGSMRRWCAHVDERSGAHDEYESALRATPDAWSRERIVARFVANTRCGLLYWRAPHAAQLARVRVPVDVVSAELDTLSTIEVGAMSAEVAGGSAQHRVLVGCGHSLQAASRAPREWVEAVLGEPHRRDARTAGRSRARDVRALEALVSDASWCASMASSPCVGYTTRMVARASMEVLWAARAGVRDPNPGAAARAPRSDGLCADDAR